MPVKEKKLNINPLLNYLEESFQELKKVTWPTKNQALRLTFLVLGFCLIAAVVVGAFDFGFSTGYRYLTTFAPPAPIEEAAPAANQPNVQVGNEQAVPPVNVNGVSAVDSNGNPIQVNVTPGTTNGTPNSAPSVAPVSGDTPVSSAPVTTPTPVPAPTPAP